MRTFPSRNPDPPSSAPPRTILLVEDSPADARLVHAMLEDEDAGVVVTAAARLEEALSRLEASRYDAVLLDLTLPDSAGLDTFSRVQTAAPSTPVVVLTGLADASLAETAVKVGAQDYLVKGRVDAHALSRALRYAIERAHVVDQLRRSEARYRTLVEGSIQGILILRAGIVHFANRAMARTLGLPDAGQLVGRSIREFVIEADPIVWDAEGRPRDAWRAGPARDELRARRADGAPIWLECAVAPVMWDDRPAVLATAVDVTDRRRAEAELRATEARFTQLADTIKEAFLVADVPSFHTTYVSRAWEDIWGRPVEDAIERPTVWMDAVDAEDRDALASAHDQVAAGAAASVVFRVHRPDGALRWVRARLFPVSEDRGAVQRLVGLAEDITDLRLTEAQLLQAQKMEAVGRLAGGIAHDFNNLLTVIVGFSELALDRLGADHALAPDIREIRQAGRSAESLTRQLLAFSRRQVLQARVLDLNDLLRRVQKMLRRLIGEDIALHLDPAEHLAHIKADPGQIEQVIMNLAVNARDAMASGGQLTIQTRNVTIDQSYVGRHASAMPGEYVMVTVADTGTGMDTETQRRLFEPFFTTKEPGRGTGLGLATVYGIVMQSGGFIVVYSEPGLGTTFKLHFPRIDDRLAAETRQEAPPARGTETVLLVEDQPELRNVAAQILRRHGYAVLEAGNAQEALALAGEGQGTIHVLLTDLVMPGLGGAALATALQMLRPDLRAVYMSGYSDETFVRQGVLAAPFAFLQKPFTPSALLDAVRQALDGPPSRPES
ncbi:MAG: response regulator [Vicinamibacterales bacterium]